MKPFSHGTLLVFVGLGVCGYPASAQEFAPHGASAAVAVVVSTETTRRDPHGEFRYTQPRPDLDASFAHCVADALVAARVPLRVVDRASFNAVAFPGVDARNAPRSLDAIRLLLDNVEFQRRLASAGIRYIAVIGGGTEVSDTQGGIFCGGAGVGAGCIGVVWWDNTSKLSAVIIDVAARAQASSAAAEATDASFFGMVLLPFAKPSLVDAVACPRIGAAVADALVRIDEAVR
jgi:hypothetical protein